MNQRMQWTHVRLLCLVTLILFFSVARQQAQNQQVQESISKTSLDNSKDVDRSMTNRSAANGFTISRNGPGTVCRPMTTEQVKDLRPDHRTEPMRVIADSHPRQSQQPGLKIVLRGTSQLEQNPQAKRPFFEPPQSGNESLAIRSRST